MPQPIRTSRLAELPLTGAKLYLPGSSGAPLAFMRWLVEDPERSAGLDLLTSYVPGINTLDMARLHPTARVTGLFMQPGLAAAQRERRYRILPLSYAGFTRHLREGDALGLSVVQLSPPDAKGRCSLGPAAEFTPVALRRSRRVLGVINPRVPSLRDSPYVDYASLDFVCEADDPVANYSPRVDAQSDAVARHIAPLVEDGCMLQMGLGRVPTALAALLTDRRGLRLHSGMLCDGFDMLARAGALDEGFAHTACVVVGSQAFYDWCAQSTQLRVRGCDYTHDAAVLASLDRFTAVNSALEIDLFGQCNLEHAQGRAVSGAGGSPDFARAARQSPGGRSIVALDATHGGGAGSRIVASLSPRAIVTLPRVDVDYVVTEYGAARVSGLCVHSRAEALIGVAAPQFREELTRAWRSLAAQL